MSGKFQLKGGIREPSSGISCYTPYYSEDVY
jgi:hypothetical protein